MDQNLDDMLRLKPEKLETLYREHFTPQQNAVDAGAAAFEPFRQVSIYDYSVSSYATNSTRSQ